MRGRFASEYALAESGLQGFAPTGSPGLDSLGCGLVVCLRSIRFRLATDTLPFSATVRIQLDRRSFTRERTALPGTLVPTVVGLHSRADRLDEPHIKFAIHFWKERLEPVTAVVDDERLKEEMADLREKSVAGARVSARAEGRGRLRWGNSPFWLSWS